MPIYDPTGTHIVAFRLVTQGGLGSSGRMAASTAMSSTSQNSRRDNTNLEQPSRPALTPHDSSGDSVQPSVGGGDATVTLGPTSASGLTPHADRGVHTARSHPRPEQTLISPGTPSSGHIPVLRARSAPPIQGEHDADVSVPWTSSRHKRSVSI